MRHVRWINFKVGGQQILALLGMPPIFRLQTAEALCLLPEQGEILDSPHLGTVMLESTRNEGVANLLIFFVAIIALAESPMLALERPLLFDAVNRPSAAVLLN